MEAGMGDESWQQARLIPTSGINGEKERERRATSATLAVMKSVKDFGLALVKPLGAFSGNIDVFIEVPFPLNDQRLYPDGLIRITRGSKRWVALVEVKTGVAKLEKQQIENYLDVARDEEFDAVITISNEIATMPGVHPVDVDKRKTKKVDLFHLSWTQILTEAVMQKVHRRIEDPDQAWILGELIRYLEHPNSGALDFEDMGASWTNVRDAVQTGTFRETDKSAMDVVSRWDQLMRYVSLRMGKQLGIEVSPVFAKNDLANPAAYMQSSLSQLGKKSTLDGVIRVNGAIAPISIIADLRATQVTTYVEIAAPKDGRQLTKVSWLLRQLQNAPDGVRIDCFAAHSRGASTSELLKLVRDDPKVLIGDGKRDIRTFRVALSAPMGTKRAAGKGGFVQSVTDLVDDFYENVVRSVKPWAPKAPPIRNEERSTEPVKPESLIASANSSQDGPETVAADHAHLLVVDR
jgi:hypothetical protein